jgi:hypothetical protein
LAAIVLIGDEPLTIVSWIGNHMTVKAHFAPSPYLGYVRRFSKFSRGSKRKSYVDKYRTSWMKIWLWIDGGFQQ